MGVILFRGEFVCARVHPKPGWPTLNQNCANQADSQTKVCWTNQDLSDLYKSDWLYIEVGLMENCLLRYIISKLMVYPQPSDLWLWTLYEWNLLKLTIDISWKKIQTFDKSLGFAGHFQKQRLRNTTQERHSLCKKGQFTKFILNNLSQKT